MTHIRVLELPWQRLELDSNTIRKGLEVPCDLLLTSRSLKHGEPRFTLVSALQTREHSIQGALITLSLSGYEFLSKWAHEKLKSLLAKDMHGIAMHLLLKVHIYIIYMCVCVCCRCWFTEVYWSFFNSNQPFCKPFRPDLEFQWKRTFVNQWCYLHARTSILYFVQLYLHNANISLLVSGHRI